MGRAVHLVAQPGLLVFISHLEPGPAVKVQRPEAGDPTGFGPRPRVLQGQLEGVIDTELGSGGAHGPRPPRRPAPPPSELAAAPPTKQVPPPEAPPRRSRREVPPSTTAPPCPLVLLRPERRSAELIRESRQRLAGGGTRGAT